jgi:cullin 3
VTDEEIDQEMAKALVVFRFLREKDMFERYYKQHLAKRLLLKKTVNDQWEQNMVLKLKVISALLKEKNKAKIFTFIL